MIEIKNSPLLLQAIDLVSTAIVGKGTRTPREILELVMNPLIPPNAKIRAGMNCSLMICEKLKKRKSKKGSSCTKYTAAYYVCCPMFSK